MADDIRVPVKVTGADAGADDLEALADAATQAGTATEDLRNVPVKLTGADAAAQDLNQVGTAAQRAAAELSQTAARMSADLADTKAAAAALADALGPELAGQINMDAALAELRNLGLTMDDVRAEAEPLAASLKQLADVKIDANASGLPSLGGSMKDARQSSDELGESARSSKSVLANMVGNSVQDLGSLGGIAGSAGVAIGQMGEYMADAAGSGEGLGSILKSFGGVAGPTAAIAAVTFAFGALQKQMADARQAAEDLRKAQDDLRKGDPTSWVEEVNKQFGRLIPSMERAGVSADDFMKVVRGETSLEDFRRRLQDNANALELFGGGALTAGGQLDDLVKAFQDNERSAGKNTANYKFLADALGLVVTGTGEFITKEEAAKRAAEAILDPIKKQAEEQQKAKDAAQEQADALAELNDAQRAYYDNLVTGEQALFGARKGQDDFLDTLAKVPDALASARKEATDNADAARNMQLVYDGVAQSALTLAQDHQSIAETMAQARGETLSAADAQRALLNSLVLSASQAKGESRDAIIDLIASLTQLPKQTVLDIFTQAETPEQIAQKLDDATPDAVDVPVLMSLSPETIAALSTALATAVASPPTATVPTDADTTDADKAIAGVVTGKYQSTVDVLADVAAFEYMVGLMETATYQATIGVDADTSAAATQITDVADGPYLSTIGVRIDPGDLSAVNATLASLNSRTVTVRVGLDVIQSDLVRQLLAGPRGLG